MVSPATHGSQDGSETSADEAAPSTSRTNTPPASRSSISGFSSREREDAPSSRGSSPNSSGKTSAALALEESIVEESRHQTPDKSSPACVSRLSISSTRRSQDWAEGHLPSEFLFFA